MENTETYNGWTNRETWVVRVHDFFDYEHVVEAIDDKCKEITIGSRHAPQRTTKWVQAWLADWMQELHEEYLEELNLNPYVTDLLGDHRINWLELASHYEDEISERIKSTE